jgi:hypothetical protein
MVAIEGKADVHRNDRPYSTSAPAGGTARAKRTLCRKRQGVLDPTVPVYPIFNPGYAEADGQQVWGAADADIIREGMTPQAAAEKALARIGVLLAK